MMAVEVQPDTPLAIALQNAAQSKLAEMGWTSGGLDDSALAEYIVLMVINGKTPEEVASELSSDLLDDPTAIANAPAFAQWLFERLNELDRQERGQSGPSSNNESMMTGARQQQTHASAQDPGGDMQDGMQSDDADMGDTVADGSIPTGPKNMRAGISRDRRMLGQMNKTLDRSNDSSLHRIKGAAGGAGRINSHRDLPRGPAGSTPRGPRGTMTRLANAQQPSPRQMAQMQQQMGANNPFNMTPEQQMQLMAMYEQQAKMMSQIFGMPPQQGMMPVQGGPGFGQTPQQSGKSLFDRVDSRAPRQNGQFNKPADGTTNGEMDVGSSMEVEPSSQGARPDPSNTMCRFNLTCTKADCHFVHQSPAAPPGISIDMSDVCAFGAACKNRKCTGKHPSPAKLGPLQQSAMTQECKFYPNCTNPTCPFQHPTMPPCRNGANCTVQNCKFFHSKVQCKFDPCLNPSCPYKHVDGQKRGSYADKVWVKPGEEGSGDHVSDRKFVDETAGDEELIRPEGGGGDGKGGVDGAQQGVTQGPTQADGIVT